LQTVTKTFYLLFTKVDREADYAQAWEVLEERYGKDGVTYENSDMLLVIYRRFKMLRPFRLAMRRGITCVLVERLGIIRIGMIGARSAATTSDVKRPD
jgi:hypothetical protein